MNDMEDFINTKNRMGPDNYNNFDISKWPVDGIKQILKNLCGEEVVMWWCMQRTTRLVIGTLTTR